LRTDSPVGKIFPRQSSPQPFTHVSPKRQRGDNSRSMAFFRTINYGQCSMSDRAGLLTRSPNPPCPARKAQRPAPFPFSRTRGILSISHAILPVSDAPKNAVLLTEKEWNGRGERFV